MVMGCLPFKTLLNHQIIMPLFAAAYLGWKMNKAK
jgi:hypothetical protein